VLETSALGTVPVIVLPKSIFETSLFPTISVRLQYFRYLYDTF
jgi:hypothetical protein